MNLPTSASVSSSNTSNVPSNDPPRSLYGQREYRYYAEGEMTKAVMDELDEGGWHFDYVMPGSDKPIVFSRIFRG